MQRGPVDTNELNCDTSGKKQTTKKQNKQKQTNKQVKM